MGLTWTIEKEIKFQDVYGRVFKKNPKLANNILSSIEMMYNRDDYFFWWGIKRKLSERKAIYQRRVRINRYVRSMRFTFQDCLKGPWTLYLVTLTFSDESLARNEFKSLKQAVTRYMSSQCLDYIGCADYGKKNRRLHFHFICVVAHSKLIEVTERSKRFLQFSESWVYGFHNISIVNNLKRQFYYAMKLSNYCFKNETSDNRPFHKRGVKHWVGADDYEENRLINELEARFSQLTSSGFEVAETKTVYQPPSVIFADELYRKAFTRSQTEVTQQSIGL